LREQFVDAEPPDDAAGNALRAAIDRKSCPWLPTAIRAGRRRGRILADIVVGCARSRR
jgi:hypothetical protein